MKNRLVLLMLLALFQSGAFAAVYKCEQDGKVAYQASPCANGGGILGKVKQPAPPSAAASGGAVAATAGTRKCQGKEISINFRDVPVKTMLNLLADFSGYKLVVDPSVSGSGAFSYQCVAWDAVLQDVASRHELDVKIEKGTLFVRKR